MEFTEKIVRGLPVFHLQGKIMGDCQSEQFCKRLHDLIDAGETTIILDMSRVKWINSHGIGLLISCVKQSRAKGGDLHLTGVQGRVAQYLAITRLDTQLQIYTRLDDALDKLSSEGTVLGTT